MTQDQFTRVTEWQDATFPASTSLSKLMHLEEEIQEVKQALVEYSNQPNGEMQYPLQLEFADCFILLFGAAKAAGMTYESLQLCIDLKLQINQDRVWSAPDENGVVKHIPGTKKFSTDEQF